jgi:predicted phage-related endonuclease
MNSNLELIPLKGKTREWWLDQRQYGIGGSDIGSILGLDRFKPALKLFHQKIGLWNTDESDNIAAYAGRISEEHIYNHYWKYWNPDLMEQDAIREMMDNAKDNIVVRKAKRVNAIITNPEYPWLRANIDYEINKWSKRDNGILELKTGNSKYWSQYEAELPTPYIFQVQMYMLVTGYEYAEIFGLLDGRFPKMFHFERNETLVNTIIEETKKFWDAVGRGKEIMAMDIPLQEKIARVGEIDPEVDAEDSSEQYLKDFHKSIDATNSVASTDEIEDLRVSYIDLQAKLSEMDKEKKLISNQIRKEMIEGGLIEIVLEDGKSIKYNNNRLTIPKLPK